MVTRCRSFSSADALVQPGRAIILKGMSNSHRVQIMMEPKDYERLQVIARARQTSVAELIRIAVRERWLERSVRAEAMQAILDMRLDEDFGSPEEIAAEANSRFKDVH